MTPTHFPYTDHCNEVRADLEKRIADGADYLKPTLKVLIETGIPFRLIGHQRETEGALDDYTFEPVKESRLSVRASLNWKGKFYRVATECDPATETETAIAASLPGLVEELRNMLTEDGYASEVSE